MCLLDPDAALCGDGDIDGSCGEQCDDGNTDGGDGCSATCQIELPLECSNVPRVDCRQQFVAGKNATVLRDLFAGDDYYTDTDSNAYELPTFLGNHDMGRLSALLKNGGVASDELLARVELANQLMFLTRGQPVTYYGDEQGFIGAGGDKDARQDMFKTSTQQYATEANLFGSGAAVRVRNLVVSVASASPHRVDATVNGMVARGGEVLT